MNYAVSILAPKIQDQRLLKTLGSQTHYLDIYIYILYLKDPAPEWTNLSQPVFFLLVTLKP